MSRKYENLDDVELILDSPIPVAHKNNAHVPPDTSKPRTDAESRDAILKQELESLRRINGVIEGVVESLEKARSNVDTVQTTVNSASTLLETWSRILSQAEHNQRLILNPRWQGATQDLADMENEQARKALESQRRHLEEQQRRETAARKAEEDEKKRIAVAGRGTKTSRGHSRLGSRTVPSSTGNNTKPGASRGLSRTGSTSSRGTNNSITGRSRGLRGRGGV